MIKTASCPNDAALQHYSEGWADAIETQDLEQHLTTCEKCEQRLSELETARVSDGLIEALRLRGQIPTQAMTTGSTPSSSPVAVDDLKADAELQQVLAEIREWPLSAVASPDAEVPLPKSVGQYELLERIGQGGMAHVYRARHSKLQRTVAVKLLNVPKWQVDRSLARLEREIAVVGQLHHLAIVAATDAGQHDGTPYLVTEFIDGLNLSQLARAVPAGTQLKTADACEAIRVAALGLAHAHSQGVTHRDIKPSNLMIDRQGNVKILDFGLVHLEGWQDENLELTTVGQLLGTLDYMAPEQADKATAVDHRSDVYALGATLFRLLCGRAPHAASLYQSPLEKLRLLALTEPPKVETLRPDVPRELAALVDQTLERDPARRPPSAAHVAEALVPFCAGAELGAWVQRAIANPPLPLPTAARGLATPLSSMIDSADQTKQVPATQPAGRGRSTWPWWIAAAAGAAAMWMGILLILDEQKGQLVIESESADVRVTLRRDGQPSATLQLQPGLNQTRVFAGTYEIEIDGPADAFQMDRDTIVIKRGEVVLARVSRRAVAGGVRAETTSAELQPGEPELADGTGPVYSGKSYSQWRDIFRAETNPAEKNKAFQALVSFSSPPHIGQTRDVLLGCIAQGNPDESMLRTADAIHGIDEAGWEDLRNSLGKLPAATAARTIHSLRLLASPAVKPLRGSESSWPPSRDRVLPYLDLVQHQLSGSGSDWSVAERKDILTGLLDLVRLPYRNADEQAAVEARLWEITRQPSFDHRCWYAVRNDPFWERSAEVRGQIDSAIIDSMPAQFEVSMEFMEAILAVNSLHSRCTPAQKAMIVAHMDRLLQTVGIEHLRARSGFATFLDFAGRFELALFDLPEQKFYRSDSSLKPDWEMGAKQLELFSYARQRPAKIARAKFPVIVHPELAKIAGQRTAWLEMNLQQNHFYYHVVDLVVLTHIRFSDELGPSQLNSGLVQLADLVRETLTPLMPKLAELGVPGQNLVLNTDWAFPEPSSQIYWGKRATEPTSVVVTREQLSAMLVSASVDRALRGEQPAGPIWLEHAWGNQTIPLLPKPPSSEATNDATVSPAGPPE